MKDIGRLTEVDVRELWQHEQYNFSNWLAEDNNLVYLNDILGLTLTDVGKEVYVGPYRCDLVAKDETTDTTIIIENQLENTDHGHLGKIITYASGLDAEVIVWIVKTAKEEHRAAIEWLNNNTADNIHFFLIEIHAYRIGDSAPAPKFEIIEQPNGFVKRNKKGKTSNEELDKRQSEILLFWEQFNQAVADRGKPFNLRKVTTDHWYDIAIGSSEAHIAVNLVNKDGVIVVELYINNNKELFDHLYQYKEEIETKLGIPLAWDRLERKKAARIKHYIHHLNFDDHSNYDSLINQVIDSAVKMRDIFKEYLL